MRTPLLLSVGLALALLIPAAPGPVADLAGPGIASAKYQETKPVGWGPRSGEAAAKLGKRSR